MSPMLACSMDRRICGSCESAWFLLVILVYAATVGNIVSGQRQLVGNGLRLIPLRFEDQWSLRLSDINVAYSTLIAYSEGRNGTQDHGDYLLLALTRVRGSQLEFRVELHRIHGQETGVGTLKVDETTLNEVTVSLRRLTHRTNTTNHTSLEVLWNSTVVLHMDTPSTDDDLLMAPTGSIFLGALPPPPLVTAAKSRVSELDPLIGCLLNARRDGSENVVHGGAGKCPQCQPSTCSNNGGMCSVMGSGKAGCDCRGTGFYGERCLSEHKVISFTGDRCSTIRLPGTQQVSRYIGLRLRINERSQGVILDSQHAKVSVVSKSIRVEIKERGARMTEQLNINTWHHVFIRLGLTETRITIDGREQELLTYGHHRLHDNHHALTVGCQRGDREDKLVHTCLQELTFSRDTHDTSWTTRLWQHSWTDRKWPRTTINHHGDHGGQNYPLCYQTEREFNHQVQFVTRQSSLNVTTFRGLNLFFSFRTSKSAGIMARATGTRMHMFIEVECGRTTLTISGLGVHMQSSVIVNDGEVHTVRVEREGCRLAMTVDSEKVRSHVDGACFNNLELGSRLYLGGTQESRASGVIRDLVKDGFAGCMNNVFVDDEDRSVNILVDDSTEGVEKGCYRSDNARGSRPCDVCQNNGRCTDEVTGLVCDCSHTDKTGPTCSEDPLVVTFGDTNPLSVSFGQEHQDCLNWTASLQLRPTYDALQGSRGGVLVMYDEYDRILLTLYLNDSFIIVAIRELQIDDLELSLEDGEWSQIDIAVTQHPAGNNNLTVSVNGVTRTRPLPSGIDPFNPGYRVVLATSILGENIGKFEGCMRNVYIGTDDLLQQIYDSIDAKSRDLVVLHEPLFSRSCEEKLYTCPDAEVLLAESGSHFSFDLWSTRDNNDIRFEFVTDIADGMILASSGDHDYLYLMLSSGRLCLYIRVGDYEQHTCVGSGLNDVQEHNVTLQMDYRGISFLLGGHMSDRLQPSTRFNVDRRLLVGSAYSTCDSNRSFLAIRNHTAVPDVVGFAGCLRNLRVNRLCLNDQQQFMCKSYNAPRVPDMYKGLDGLQRGTVYSSCKQNFCDLKKVCKHGGVCWRRVTVLSCNCRGTGHIGPACADPAPAITFPCNHYAVMSLSTDQRRPKLSESPDESAFVLSYRAHEPENITQIAALHSSSAGYLLQLLQDGPRIILQTRFGGPVLTLRSEEIATLLEFRYHIIQVYFKRDEFYLYVQMRVYLEDLAGDIIYSGILQHLDAPDVEVDKIEIAQFQRPAADGFLAGKPLCGHFREAVFNDASIIQEVLLFSPNVSTTAVMDEARFDNYTVHVATSAAHKNVAVRESVTELRLDFRAHGRQDAILLTMYNGQRLQGNNLLVLLHQGGLLLYREMPASTKHALFMLPYRLDNGHSHSLNVSIRAPIIQVTIDSDLRQGFFNVSFPEVPDRFSFFDIGGGFRLKTPDAILASTADDIKTDVGFVGCIERLQLDGQFIDLPKAESRGTVTASDITEGCPRCLVQRVCGAGFCQEPGDGSVTCNCSRTSLSGDRCDVLPTTTVATTTVATTTAQPITSALKHTAPTTLVVEQKVTTEEVKPTAVDKVVTAPGEGGKGRGGNDEGGSTTWLPILIIILLIILALLLCIIVYLVMRYRRRYTGMFKIDESEVSPSKGKPTMI
eukprot:scpid8011/ scgid5535/ Neurexin-2-alpha; Neurexin II-alpha